MKQKLIALVLTAVMLISAGAVGVSATEPDEFPFGDVTAARWSNPYVVLMYNAGIVNGMQPNVFSPASNVTRAQFVKMLGGVARIDADAQQTTLPFDDVAPSAWYAPYVAWAYEAGIVNGIRADLFNPEGNIKRQEMATMIYRYTQSLGEFDLPEVNDPSVFSDATEIDTWASDAVYALQTADIIGGVSNGDGTSRFEPRGVATREQACKMLAVLYCALYDATLPAPVAPPAYQITYNLNGGKADGLKTTYTGDDTFTLPTPTRNAYTFDGWSGTGIWGKQQNVTVKRDSAGDRTYTANWSLTQFGITYKLGGGTISGAPASYTIETPTFTVPTPTRPGYTFVGWSGTGISGTTMTYTVNKGTVGWITLTANWISNQEKAFDLMKTWINDNADYSEDGYNWCVMSMNAPSNEFKQDIWVAGYSSAQNKICLQMYHEYIDGAEYLSTLYLQPTVSSFEYSDIYVNGSSYFAVEGLVSSTISNTMNITYKKLDASSDFSTTEDVTWIKEQVRTGLCNLKVLGNQIFIDIGRYGYDMISFGL